VNDLLAPLRNYLKSRSPRERWLLVAGACALALVIVYSMIVAPLGERARGADLRVAQLELDLIRAVGIAREMRTLQGELASVEARIQPGSDTNLIALLSTLAADAKISQEQLESIEPKQPSTNAKYPETRAEVRLKGTSLEQMVEFLQKIETSSAHLIVRSLKIRSRGEGPSGPVLDVSFSVSSFERA
jgi:type II secretory pathway component PulM